MRALGQLGHLGHRAQQRWMPSASRLWVSLTALCPRIGIVSRTSRRCLLRNSLCSLASSRLCRKTAWIRSCRISCARKCCSVLWAKPKGTASASTPKATFQSRSRRACRCASASLTLSRVCYWPTSTTNTGKSRSPTANLGLTASHVGTEAHPSQQASQPLCCSPNCYCCKFSLLLMFTYLNSRTSAKTPAMRRASNGGTALPTWTYCDVRGPSKK